MAIKGIDHIVIAVKDLDQGVATYRDTLGMTLEHTSESSALRVKSASFRLGDGRVLELVQPLGPEGPVARALAGRGEGVYHVSLAVDDIAQTARDLQAKGVELLGVAKPDGRVYIHPRSTNGVLIQLIQRA